MKEGSCAFGLGDSSLVVKGYQGNKIEFSSSYVV